MLTFRPFDYTSLADYEAGIAIQNTARPDDLFTVGEWQSDDKTRDASYFFVRMLAEKDGASIGFLECSQSAFSHEDGKFEIKCLVLPDFIDCYEAVLDHGLDLVINGQNATKVVTGLSEDKTDAVKLHIERGFVPEMRYPISELQIAEFDFAAYKPLCKRVTESGIVILSLADYQAIESVWQQKVYTLDDELTQDVPLPFPYNAPPVEQFWHEVTSKPSFNAETWFLAVDGGTVSAESPAGDLVGMSTLFVAPAQQEKLFTGMTGIRRPYRRRGIATALKVRAIQCAADIGATSIQADNEENNPMYGLNIGLGFRPKPAWVDFKKEIGSKAAGD